jgi:hypothetical protein
MFGILAKSFMTATRNGTAAAHPEPRDLPKLTWLQEDMPFQLYAVRRGGRDD